MPQDSCPRPPGSVGKLIHAGPSQGTTLDAQTPQPSTRTRTSPGPGSGMATSATPERRGPSTTAARILSPFAIRPRFLPSPDQIP